MEGFERLCLDTIVQGNVQVGSFTVDGYTYVCFTLRRLV